jgi:hypothetical protein
MAHHAAHFTSDQAIAQKHEQSGIENVGKTITHAHPPSRCLPLTVAHELQGSLDSSIIHMNGNPANAMGDLTNIHQAEHQ